MPLLWELRRDIIYVFSRLVSLVLWLESTNILQLLYLDLILRVPSLYNNELICHSNVGVSVNKRRRRRRREVVVVVVKRLQGAVSKARLGRAFPGRETGGDCSPLSSVSCCRHSVRTGEC